MAYKLYHAFAAHQDIFGILDYLTEHLDSKAAARHFQSELTACYKRLRENPYLYPVCREERIAARGFHCAPVMRYIIFYTFDEEKCIVRIHRIIHGTRDYAQMLG